MTKNTLDFLVHFFISKTIFSFLGNYNGTEEKPEKLREYK
jgi:hypothetical protein